ncbi:MAG: hypothetical protein QJR06_05010 [Alicyclobacillaceae bacterium]|nr:hypothetical protein [Alicyclobacillaceae bacterium]
MQKIFKSGDEVWHLRYGRGRVVSVSAGSVLVMLSRGETAAFNADDWALWPWPPWRRIRISS